MCGAGRSPPSQREIVTRPGFPSPNQPDRERTTAYRDSPEPDSSSDAHYVTIIGDCDEPSGESRLFAHMGYLIGDKRYWSSRAALDAVTLICDFAFFERGARKILEPTTDDHIASNFNFRRLGFTYEGKFPDLYWSGGTYRAAVYWSMTARHWAELREHDPNEVTR